MSEKTKDIKKSGIKEEVKSIIKDKEIKKKVEKINETFKEDIDLALVEDILKNNEYLFTYKDVKYKVRKPSFGEKQAAYEKKVEREIYLLEAKDENGKYRYKSAEDLKKLYKNRGIDVDELDNKFLTLEQKKNDLKLKLGKGLKDKKPKNELKIYHDEIFKIDLTQKELSFKKAKLLEISIENQLDIMTYSYLTYLISEKLVDEKWVKVWNSYEEFKSSPDDIINKVSYYAVLIVQNEV